MNTQAKDIRSNTYYASVWRAVPLVLELEWVHMFYKIDYSSSTYDEIEI